MENSDFLAGWTEKKAHFEQMVEHHYKLMLKMVENLLSEDYDSNEHEKLGEGNLAKVFSVGHIHPCCIKIIKKPEHRTVQNNYSFDHEFDFQSMVSRMSRADRVQIPRVLSSVSDPETGLDFFFMDKVDGNSLRQIFNGEASLPDNFDMDVFFGKLEKFIEDFNNDGYYHRDLHAGNIMVDREGNPWVIDFGSSIHQPGASEDIFSEQLPDGQTIHFTSDENSLRKVMRETAKHLTSLNS